MAELTWTAGRSTDPKALRWEAIAALALGLLVVVMSAVRIWLASVQPLWLDETWTAMVAQADWADTGHLLRVDPNPPLYYLIVKLWTQVAGLSDLALRLPGIAFLAGAAFLAARLKLGGLDRLERIGWAALLFAWWGVDQFLMARCYSLLLLLAVLQLTAFVRLLERPTTRAALAWGCIAAASVLTHYYAAPIVLAQGLAYLLVYRGRALRTWPAAMAFAPVAGWMAWHAPSLARFTDQGVAWHPALDWPGVLRSATFVLHPTALLAALAAAGVLAIGVIPRKDAPRPAPSPDSAVWIAVAASWAGLALVLASAIWRPTLIARYLIPAVPGVMLALVMLARGSRTPKLTLAAMAGIYIAVLATPLSLTRGPHDASVYGTERASAFLIQNHVTDVVFLWDHETAAIQDPRAMRALGDVFFQRAGYPVRIGAPHWRKGDDLNQIAVDAATGPRPGIIWIYNRNTDTSARLHPPAIAAADPRWTCRDVSVEQLGAYACFKAG